MADVEDDPEPEENAETRETIIFNREIYYFYGKNKHLPSAEIVELYQKKFSVSTEDTGPSLLAIYRRLKDVYEKVTKKLRGAKKTEFLNKEFIRPTTQDNYVSTMKKDTPRKRALRQDLL